MKKTKQKITKTIATQMKIIPFASLSVSLEPSLLPTCKIMAVLVYEYIYIYIYKYYLIARNILPTVRRKSLRR